MVQLEPSHRSAKVSDLEAFGSFVPTAHTFVPEIPLTPEKNPDPNGGCDGDSVQSTPSQCSMKGCCVCRSERYW